MSHSDSAKSFSYLNICSYTVYVYKFNVHIWLIILKLDCALTYTVPFDNPNNNAQKKRMPSNLPGVTDERQSQGQNMSLNLPAQLLSLLHAQCQGLE